MKTNAIPVKYLRFVVPQDGPAMVQVSGCRAVRDGRPTAWRIEYHPGIQMFRIEHESAGVEFVPVHRVSSWAVLSEVSGCSSGSSGSTSS